MLQLFLCKNCWRFLTIPPKDVTPNIPVCLLSSWPGLFCGNNFPFLHTKPSPSLFRRPCSVPTSFKSIYWCICHLNLVISHYFIFTCTSSWVCVCSFFICRWLVFLTLLQLFWWDNRIAFLICFLQCIVQFLMQKHWVVFRKIIISPLASCFIE